MNISRRLAGALLIAAIVLFLGLLFWPFLLNNLIRPVALVLWLLLRILVLSIHQQYFWYAVILAAFLVLIRLLPWEQPAVPPEIFLEPNTTLNKIRYWRSLFLYTDQNVQEEKTLRNELIHLLTSFYASSQRKANNFRIYEALQHGEIPLPENIHRFLFPPQPQASGGRLSTFFRSVREAPRQWVRRWTGQEKAEHFQRIEDVLQFMETSLEIKHDDRKLSQDQH
jgi:hypothetical protein